MNLSVGREGFRVKAAERSVDFFSVLGVDSVLGRTFSANEDLARNNSVGVISFGLWQQLFAARPDIRGTVMHVNGAPITVVGVMPASFDYPAKTGIWLPTAFDFEKVPKRGALLFQTIGRLKNGVSIRKASALFQAEVRRKATDATDELNRPRIASLRDQLAGPVRSASWVLAGLTLLVLLTACANVAQLLLSRTIDRRSELDLRAALGASRGRLLQQLVTEALLLTTAGAVLGLLVASWTARITSLFAPPRLVTQAYAVFDWPVIGFALALTLLTALIFGALPIVAMRGNSPIRARQIRMILVGLQTGLALCLVTGSLCMGKAFLELLHADLGFRPQSVVTVNVSLQGTQHTGAGEYAYYSSALNQLRAVPGMTSVGAVAYLPLATNVYMANAFHLDSGQAVSRVITNAVTPGYFHAMGTRFLAGGDFVENSGKDAGASVIVDETFAKAAGLGNTIIGRVDATVPIYDVETLDESLAATLARPRFYTTVTAFLSLLAMLLAAVGSYGTAAYSIAQRRTKWESGWPLGPPLRACGQCCYVKGFCLFCWGRWLEFLCRYGRAGIWSTFLETHRDTLLGPPPRRRCVYSSRAFIRRGQLRIVSCE